MRLRDLCINILRVLSQQLHGQRHLDYSQPSVTIALYECTRPHLRMLKYQTRLPAICVKYRLHPSSQPRPSALPSPPLQRDCVFRVVTFSPGLTALIFSLFLYFCQHPSSHPDPQPPSSASSISSLALSDTPVAAHPDSYTHDSAMDSTEAGAAEWQADEDAAFVGYEVGAAVTGDSRTSDEFRGASERMLVGELTVWNTSCGG